MSTDTGERERQRNPRGEGERLRGEIIDAARVLVAANEAMTLRSVARQAGIAAPSIYRHFRDVDAIMSVLTEDAFRVLTQVLRDAQEGLDAPDARLMALARAYLDYARREPGLYRLMFGAQWDAAAALETYPDRAQRFAEMGMDAFGLLVESVAACANAGSSTSADPRRDAVALWAGLHGLAGLRVAASLFDWPDGIDETIVRSLARLSSSDS
jgi:AcrR family transcriptional regulator